MKADQNLRVVPVVVLGSQMQASDIKRLYDESASCVIRLPDNLPELEHAFGIIKISGSVTRAYPKRNRSNRRTWRIAG